MRVAAGRDFGYENVAAVNVAMDKAKTVQVIQAQCRLMHYFLVSQSLQDNSHLLILWFSLLSSYQILH